MKRYVFPAILLACGVGLEVYFYASRFHVDGYAWWFSAVIGIALNFLLVLSMLKKQHVLAIALIVFSVISTSAGQTFSLLKTETVEASKIDKARLEKDIAGMERDISAWDAERDAINARAAGNIEEAAKYRTATKNDRDRLKEIEVAKGEARGRIDVLSGQLRDAMTKATGDVSIYTFYAGIGKWCGTEWLKFVLHTVLSIFIALMAPLGLRCLGQKDEAKEAPRPEIMPIEEWVGLMWIGEKSGKAKVPTEELIAQWAASKGKPFSVDEHRARVGEAIACQLVSMTGDRLKSKEEALKHFVKKQKTA